jgi:hypothetical protein
LPWRLEAIDSQHAETVALSCGPLVLFAITGAPPVVTARQLLAAKKNGPQWWQVETAQEPMAMLPFTAIEDQQILNVCGSGEFGVLNCLFLSGLTGAWRSFFRPLPSILIHKIDLNEKRGLTSRALLLKRGANQTVSDSLVQRHLDAEPRPHQGDQVCPGTLLRAGDFCRELQE